MFTPRSSADLTVFYRERARARAEAAQQLRRLEPFVNDQWLVFDGIDPAELFEIQQICRQADLDVTFLESPVYRDEEIRHAHFVPLLAAGNEIDSDRDGQALNSYPTRLCEVCGSNDLFHPPDPFVVRQPKRTRGLSIWNAGNGIRIMTRELWSHLASDIDAWAITGEVAYTDGRPARELLRIMPKYTIGSYLRHRILRSCERCARPTEIRGARDTDPLLRSLRVVEHKGHQPMPIALIGNWFGSVQPKQSVSWDVVIGGELHARLTELRVRGHVEADEIIQTAKDLPPPLAARLDSSPS
jgi:hypothetical protein